MKKIWKALPETNNEMVFKITHQTKYTFNELVFLEPHTMRFYPADPLISHVKDFTLQVSPTPVGTSFQIDSENNPVHFCWFESTTNELIVSAAITVENREHNPFNFIFHPPSFSYLPYTDYPQQFLQPYLVQEGIHQSLKAYGDKLLQENKNETLSFLLSLTRQINHDFSIQTRDEGPPLPASETFNTRTGSCRDLAWMQIQLLRQLGIAARFCSGYYYVDDEQPAFELHAWAEVFIPGAGWLGLDPTAGLITGMNYIKVASGAHYSTTNPVQGTFRGKAMTTLNTELQISIIG